MQQVDQTFQPKRIDPFDEFSIEINDLFLQHPKMLETHPNHETVMLTEAMAGQRFYDLRDLLPRLLPRHFGNLLWASTTLQ